MGKYETTDYLGIDYGRGLANIDLETGIRYGVISAHEIGQSWYDSSEPEYGKPACPKCGGEVIAFDTLTEQLENGVSVETIVPEALDNWTRYSEYQVDEYACENCEVIFEGSHVYPEDPLYFYYDREGYTASQSHDNSDIFVIKSPYFTYCQYCSPCAPGAGYLKSPMSPSKGIRAYCFGHDWFEDGKAPYPVYDVITKRRVKP
jgi:ribosomal protein L37AE/L43A